MKHTKQTIKKYLGKSSFFFDLRKKAILKDNINMNIWERNMEFLENIDDWNLKEKAHPLILKIIEGDSFLPPVLQKNQDRNWFIAAYPDVIMYFYPSIDLQLTHEEVSKKMFEVNDDFEKLQNYLQQFILNQTLSLLHMKRFYKKILRKTFLLTLQK
jgi:hypothetical protein